MQTHHTAYAARGPAVLQCRTASPGAAMGLLTSLFTDSEVEVTLRPITGSEVEVTLRPITYGVRRLGSGFLEASCKKRPNRRVANRHQLIRLS